jgi:glutamate racemase
VVLACTHFPLLEEELAEAFGPGLTFVHGAEGIARQVARLLEGQEFHRLRPDLALTTAPDQFGEAYKDALARFGIEEIGGV